MNREPASNVSYQFNDSRPGAGRNTAPWTLSLGHCNSQKRFRWRGRSPPSGRQSALIGGKMASKSAGTDQGGARSPTTAYILYLPDNIVRGQLLQPLKLADQFNPVGGGQLVVTFANGQKRSPCYTGPLGHSPGHSGVFLEGTAFTGRGPHRPTNMAVDYGQT